METPSYSAGLISFLMPRTISLAVILGPETNFCSSLLPTRNFTWEPPTSTTKMRRDALAFFLAIRSFLTPKDEFAQAYKRYRSLAYPSRQSLRRKHSNMIGKLAVTLFASGTVLAIALGSTPA